MNVYTTSTLVQNLNTLTCKFNLQFKLVEFRLNSVQDRTTILDKTTDNLNYSCFRLQTKNQFPSPPNTMLNSYDKPTLIGVREREVSLI